MLNPAAFSILYIMWFFNKIFLSWFRLCHLIWNQTNLCMQTRWADSLLANWHIPIWWQKGDTRWFRNRDNWQTEAL